VRFYPLARDFVCATIKLWFGARGLLLERELHRSESGSRFVQNGADASRWQRQRPIQGLCRMERWAL